MRRGLAWLLVVPIVGVGLLADHLAAYWIAVPDEEVRLREMAASGHAWLEHAPWLLALCIAAAAAACALIAVSARTSSATPRLPAAFALLPPVAYLLHEYVELGIQDQTLAPGFTFDRALVIGLALQVPLGVAALLLARALCSISVTFGRALARVRPLFPRVSPPRTRPTRPFAPRIPALATYHAGRAPPFAS